MQITFPGTRAEVPRLHHYHGTLDLITVIRLMNDTP
jgi:hypothetical protein